MHQTTLERIEQELKKIKRQLQCGTQFFETVEEFPAVGVPCAIYVDKSTGAFYVYDTETATYISADTGVTPELSGAGTAGQVAYWTGATTLSGESNLFWDEANNRLGINQSTPAYPLDVVGNTRIQGNLYTIGNVSYVSPSSDALTYTGFSTFNVINNGPASIAIDRFSSNATAPHFNLRKSRGTITSPSILNTNDELGYVGFWGHDGTSFQRNGIILVRAANVTGSTITPTMQFGLGTTAGANQYYINLYNTGNTSFGNSTPDLNARVGIRGAGTTSATTALLIQNSTPTELFRIYDNGNTGIGTTADNGFKLDVNGTARVQGNITTTGGITSTAGTFTLQGAGSVQFYRMNNSNGYTTISDNVGVAISGGGTHIYYLLKNITSSTYSTIITNEAGVTTSTAVTSGVVLDLRSTTGGFLPPRMTTTQRDAIASPAAGLVIFNTTTTKLECYDGSAWQAAW